MPGYVSKDLTVSSTEGESVFNTRSVARLLQTETEKTFEEKVNESLKTFATTLFQELSTVFQTKDRECVEQSRTLADWKSMAINLKEKSPALLFSLENVKFVATARQMDRNLRDIDIEVMKSQFKTFLHRLYSLTKDKSVEQLENIDAKELLKNFMRKETYYDGIEMIMQATAVSSIKLSVESIAESFISIYNIHNSKLRPIEEDTAEDEMMIHLNGPEIGEADNVLTSALD